MVKTLTISLSLVHSEEQSYILPTVRRPVLSSHPQAWSRKRSHVPRFYCEEHWEVAVFLLWGGRAQEGSYQGVQLLTSVICAQENTLVFFPLIL